MRKIPFCISMCKYVVTSNESRSSFVIFFYFINLCLFMGVPDAAGVLVDGLIVEYSYQLFFFFWWHFTGPKVLNDPAS